MTPVVPWRKPVSTVLRSDPPSAPTRPATGIDVVEEPSAFMVVDAALLSTASVPLKSLATPRQVAEA